MSGRVASCDLASWTASAATVSGPPSWRAMWPICSGSNPDIGSSCIGPSNSRGAWPGSRAPGAVSLTGCTSAVSKFLVSMRFPASGTPRLSHRSLSLACSAYGSSGPCRASAGVVASSWAAITGLTAADPRCPASAFTMADWYASLPDSSLPSVNALSEVSCKTPVSASGTGSLMIKSLASSLPLPIAPDTTDCPAIRRSAPVAPDTWPRYFSSRA